MTHIPGRPPPATSPLVGDTTSRRPTRPAGDDRGSVTVEVALAVPLSLLLFFLVLGAFHLGRATVDVNAAAAAAARAASITRTDPVAAARDSATANLATRCAQVTVDVDTRQVRRGGQVTVHLSCTVTTHGLLGIGLPGQMTLTGQSTSPLDVYRSQP